MNKLTKNKSTKITLSIFGLLTTIYVILILMHILIPTVQGHVPALLFIILMPLVILDKIGISGLLKTAFWLPEITTTGYVVAFFVDLFFFYVVAFIITKLYLVFKQRQFLHHTTPR